MGGRGSFDLQSAGTLNLVTPGVGLDDDHAEAQKQLEAAEYDKQALISNR